MAAIWNNILFPNLVGFLILWALTVLGRTIAGRRG